MVKNRATIRRILNIWSNRSLSQKYDRRILLSFFLRLLLPFYCAMRSVRSGAIIFKYRNSAHWAANWLLSIFWIKLSWANSHIVMKFLVEPHPDALFMELMLAGCCHNLFLTLFQGLLANTTVSLVGEFKIFLFIKERFHQFSQSLFLFSFPLHGSCFIASSSTTQLAL